MRTLFLLVLFTSIVLPESGVGAEASGQEPILLKMNYDTLKRSRDVQEAQDWNYILHPHLGISVLYAHLKCNVELFEKYQPDVMIRVRDLLSPGTISRHSCA